MPDIDPRAWWDATWDGFTKIAADVGMRPGTLLLVCASVILAGVFTIKLIRAKRA